MKKEKNASSKELTAKEIKYGGFDVAVAVDFQMQLFIAQPTIEKLLGWQANSGREKLISKSLKQFAGEDLKIGKVYAVVSGQGQGKTAFILFDHFLIVLKWQVSERNSHAIDLVVAGFGDSFRDYAYKEFGFKLDDNLRQAWLELKTIGIASRNDFIEGCKLYLDKHPEIEGAQLQWFYKNRTAHLYKKLFTMGGNNLKVHLGIEIGDDAIIRDYLDLRSRSDVEAVERLAANFMNKNNFEQHPDEAVNQAIEILLLSPRKPQKRSF